MHILSSPGPLEVDTASLAGNGCRHGGNIVAQLAPDIAIDRDPIAFIRRAGDSLHQRSQALRFRIRKRPQKQRVDHTENRGVRADAQCKGEDDDNGEASDSSTTVSGRNAGRGELCAWLSHPLAGVCISIAKWFWGIRLERIIAPHRQCSDLVLDVRNRTLTHRVERPWDPPWWHAGRESMRPLTPR